MRFSWVAAADSLGARIDGYRERRIEKREIAEDVRLGELAQRKREIEVEEEREEFEEHIPLVIEPPVLEVPKSERVARERQKPLFSDMPDSRLPQVDLLDAAQARLEMARRVHRQADEVENRLALHSGHAA